MRESRTYGSVRGACDETHVPTATAAGVHHAARRRGGSVAARGARAAGERCRWIGVLSQRAADDPEPQTRVAAFRQGLKRLGCDRGPERGIEYRWARGPRRSLAEHSGRFGRLSAGRDARRRRSTAFGGQGGDHDDPDRLRAGRRPGRRRLVASLARPGGNLTGFTILEFEIGGKRLELLREVAPAAATVAVLVNPANTAPSRAVGRRSQAAAPPLGLGSSPQRQHEPRDRARLRSFRARARRRSDVLADALPLFIARLIIALRRVTGCPRSISARCIRRGRRADELMDRAWQMRYRQVGVYADASSRARSRPICR